MGSTRNEELVNPRWAQKERLEEEEKGLLQRGQEELSFRSKSYQECSRMMFACTLQPLCLVLRI